MDPSIMKLFEEDEDESMHSGADVEAFTAALNRDIEGGASISQPSHSETSFSQTSNPTSSQMYSQWQPSGQDGNSANQSQQPDLRTQEQRDDTVSQIDAKEHVRDVESQQEVKDHSQSEPMQVDVKGRQAEPNQPNHAQYSQSSASVQMQISGTGHTHAHAQVPEPDRKPNISTGSQVANMQRFTGNQQAPMTEQAGASAPRQKQIPFGSLLPIILPELDKDRAMQLQTLYTKLRKNEIPKDSFVRHMRGIVGDQMLRVAVVKMQAKSQNPAQHQHPRPPAGTAAQFADPYSFAQQHQNSQSTHSMTVTGPPRNPASVMQQQPRDLGHQVPDNSSLKSRDMQHLTDSYGMQATQMSIRPAISMPGLTTQQQQHLHFSQSSFPIYGAGTYHTYTISNASSHSTMVTPRPHDPQMRPIQFHQGIGSAHVGGTSQAVNVMNVPKVETQNSFSDSKSTPGPTMPSMSTVSMQHNAGPWQGLPNKDQNHGALASMGFVKQEPADQTIEKQPKASVFQSQGPAFSGPVQIERSKVISGTSNDELPERQISGMAFPSSTRTTNMAASSSFPSRVDTDSQLGNQSTSTGPMSGFGVNKTAVKKTISGQKKPLDAHVSSPPLPSKKQKVFGGYANQSIEQLNDVTAVSGVNLREEEEQLFSLPKDDNRISEASRKAVQEEEDRLILQKVPLQKKLAEIMTKCGLKNLSNDVERCLSLCVEERLRALISSLIRVSKQRADSEKSRHGTVVTSDVREQIMMINQKAREEWEKKQAEVEKLRKQNEQPDSSAVADMEREKDEGRAKSLKVNKEEDDKMRTTAANVAARAAVGGDDMLSKWQLMAQARQKRDGGPETASSSQVGKDPNPKPSVTSAGNVRDTHGTGKKDQPGALATSVGHSGTSQVTLPPPRVAPCISVKDVIAVLEREPQMAKSTIIYRLYDRLHSDAATE